MNQTDIKENYIKELNPDLLRLLLIDQTTKRNLIWATDNYSKHGKGYFSADEITAEKITGKHGSIIRPRTEKSKEERQKRVRDKAEVFTPSWICNKQNNLVDESWFGAPSPFNKETENGWVANPEKIPFPTADGKTWQNYVEANRLEITCGEAPYLVSRYDTTTGEQIALSSRIGLLDRKLRVVNENAQTDAEWLDWAERAFKSVYGYEWQGDNVFLARENLLFTYIDNFIARFGTAPSSEQLTRIAEIISWNIWQMDGLKCVVPNSCHKDENLQMSLFADAPKPTECEGCAKNNIRKHNGIYCKIMDWKVGKSIKFVTLLRGDYK